MKVQAAKKNCSAILLIFLVASTLPLLLPQPVVAETKPSAPEFSVSYVDNSYDTPPTYEVDEFTGKTILKSGGSHVDDQSFIFKIKNQPFTPYEDSDGKTIQLCYNLRFKGHYGTTWKYFPYLDNLQGSSKCSAGIFTIYDPILPASSGIYTTITEALSIFGENRPSVGDEVDFQVQALTGHVTHSMDGDYYFSGSASDWSSTQTINLSNSPSTTIVTSMPTQTPTTSTSQTNSTENSNQSGTQQEFKTGLDWQFTAMVLAVIVVVLVSIVVVLQWKVSSKKAETSQ